MRSVAIFGGLVSAGLGGDYATQRSACSGPVSPSGVSGQDDRRRTGLCQLDRLTNGLAPGSLITIAGRPAMGKSLLSYQIADHIARVEQRAVTIVSSEGGPTVAWRMAHLQMDAWPIRRADPAQQSLDEERALLQLSNMPVLLADPLRSPLSETAARTIEFSWKCGVAPGALFVDDPAHAVVASGCTSRTNRVVAELRAVAVAMGIPVIVTASVNRAVECRCQRRPHLTDFDDPAAAFVRGADIVLTLYRDELYDINTTDPGIAELALLRHPFGHTGISRLRVGRYRFQVEDDPPPRFSMA